MLYRILLTLFIIGVFSCKKDEKTVLKTKVQVDTNGYKQIIEHYPFQNIKPIQDVDYWELDYIGPDYFESPNDSLVDSAMVLLKSGEKCKSSVDKEGCLLSFETKKLPFNGFGAMCLPGHCFNFIKYTTSGSTHIADSKESVQKFLGEIDSEDDALLLVYSAHYQFSTTVLEIGGIKELDNGYSLLVNKLVSDCAPIQTNQFILEVSRAGDITVKFEQEYSKSDACF